MIGQLVGDEMIIDDDLGNVAFFAVMPESAAALLPSLNTDLLAAYAPHLLVDDDNDPDQEPDH